MRLVFIHGWGFDATFWQPLGAALSDMPQTRVDLGFFNDHAEIPAFADGDILIGHSLGFMWGMMRDVGWGGWVAINGFARFTDSMAEKACAPAAAVRAMRQGLAKDARQVLKNFYTTIGATGNDSAPNSAHLAAGLEMLQNNDATIALQGQTARGLVLASRRDPLVPAAATEFMAAQAKTARLLWQDAGGHLLPLSHTGWCADAIKEFLS